MGKMGFQNVQPQDRNDVLEHLKKLAYAPTRKLYVIVLCPLYIHM